MTRRAVTHGLRDTVHLGDGPGEAQCTTELPQGRALVSSPRRATLAVGPQASLPLHPNLVPPGGSEDLGEPRRQLEGRERLGEEARGPGSALGDVHTHRTARLPPSPPHSLRSSS